MSAAVECLKTKIHLCCLGLRHFIRDEKTENWFWIYKNPLNDNWAKARSWLLILTTLILASKRLGLQCPTLWTSSIQWRCPPLFERILRPEVLFIRPPLSLALAPPIEIWGGGDGRPHICPKAYRSKEPENYFSLLKGIPPLILHNIPLSLCLDREINSLSFSFYSFFPDLSCKQS